MPVKNIPTVGERLFLPSEHVKLKDVYGFKAKCKHCDHLCMILTDPTTHRLQPLLWCIHCGQNYHVDAEDMFNEFERGSWE